MGLTAPGAHAHVADYGDSGFTPKTALTAAANKWKLVYALPTYLGHYLTLQIVAGTTTTIVHNEYTGTDAPADALSVNAAGDPTADGPICRIRITPTAAHYDNATISHILAHEVFHCEEFDLDPGLAHLQARTIEGLAEWAAETLEPVPGYLNVLEDYVTTPPHDAVSAQLRRRGLLGPHSGHRAEPVAHHRDDRRPVDAGGPVQRRRRVEHQLPVDVGRELL
jgi:hypothetical protein